MLSLFFGTISAFLAIRQCIILSYRKFSIFSLLIILCFSCVAWIAAPQAIRSFRLEHFLWLASILVVWLCYDIYCLKKNSFKLSPLRLFLSLIFFALSVLYLSCIKLPHLYIADPILHIQTTNEEKERSVTWKSPTGPLQTATLRARRIKIADTKGRDLFDGYLYGDMACLRLQLISFPTWMHRIGFPYLWQADMISSDYLLAERKNQLPHDAFALDSDTSSFWEMVAWRFWKEGFFLKKTPSWIQMTSLVSTHIPLVDLEGSALKQSYTVELLKIESIPTIQLVPIKIED